MFIFSQYNSEVIKLEFDKKVLEELFTERMRKYPDALTYDHISKITGRGRKFVYKWILDGRIKAVALNDRVNIVPKQWLLDYMLTDDFIYNYASCNRLKPILHQAIIER